MEECRKYLKIASMINIILGIITYSEIIYYSIFLFITGFILSLFAMEEETFQYKRQIIIAMALILIPFNLIASILLFIANDHLQGYELKSNGPNAPPVRIKKVRNPETRKIDILLKLGVGMVFISGILFATTSWDFISDPIKAIALILFGTLFVGLSFLTEKKLQLYRASYMYWLLGMAFFLLTIIGILYFGIFGDFICYWGDGEYLAYAITGYTVTGLSLATYLKFPKKYLLYINYTSVLFVLVQLLLHLEVDITIIIGIISCILLVINLFTKKDTTLSNYSKFISYIIIGFFIKNLWEDEIEGILVLIVSFVNIVNHEVLAKEKAENHEKYISLIMIYAFLMQTFIMHDTLEIDDSIFGNLNSLVFMIATMIHTALIQLNIIEVSEKYKKINYIIFTVFTLLVLRINIELTVYIATLYLVFNFLLSIPIKEHKELPIAKNLIPLSILLWIASLYNITPLFDYPFTIVFLITTIIYCICHFLVKEENKKIYLIAIGIGIIGCIFLNLDNPEFWFPCLTILPSSYLLYMGSIRNNENKKQSIFSYIIFLLSIYNVLAISNVFDIGEVLPSIIFIWILVMTILLSKKEEIKKISYFAIIIPILDLISASNIPQEYEKMLVSILVLYVTFLVIKFVTKDAENKNIAATIGIIISIICVLFNESYIIGIYIGLVGIIILLLGYFNKELKNLFFIGIIITVGNIVYQLKDLWEKIPFWLYLLIGGLTLIGIVTYKELNKPKEKPEEEKKENTQ